MINITDERKKEILEKYKENKDLFNWCEEYKQYVSECVYCCVTSEWDYILNKSIGDESNAPFSIEDIDYFSPSIAIESMLYDYDTNEEEFKELANNQYNRRVKNIGDFEVFLQSFDEYELLDVFEQLNFDRSDAEIEIYEWWIISDPLSYQLEEQGEVILNGAWGRCTTGQSITLDYCCMKAFLEWLN